MRWRKAMVSLLAAVLAGSTVAEENPWTQAARQMHEAAESQRLIVVGEMHGTLEIPKVMRALVMQAADTAPVVLALEVSRAEHAVMREYLSSDGDTASREHLLASGWWRVPADRHDGRRTEAMLELIEAIRQLRVHGADVALLPYDVAVPTGDSGARDRAMADRLRSAFSALPHGRLIVLTGNVHAMKFKPDYCPQCQTPMTAHLRDLSPYSIEISARGGAFHGCLPGGCGPVPVTPNTRQSGAVGQNDDDPFDYRIVLPSFTPAARVR